MKLQITRSQEGEPGRIRYSARYRLELTPEETGLLERYMPSLNVAYTSNIFLDLLKTRNYSIPPNSSLAAVQKTDQEARAACNDIAKYLHDAAQWDGSETISL